MPCDTEDGTTFTVTTDDGQTITVDAGDAAVSVISGTLSGLAFGGMPGSMPSAGAAG